MQIPFYRHVKYLNDGVYQYQCLYCGECICVETFQFDPLYCCCCGIKYKGRMIHKKYKYINIAPYEKIAFEVQERTIWEDERDDNEDLWTETHLYHYSPFHAIEELKKLKAWVDVNRNIIFATAYRIRVTKRVQCDNIKIDTAKFLLKTGKSFDIKKYENHFKPEEIICTNYEKLINI